MFNYLSIYMILFVMFCVTMAVQLIYYVFFFGRFAFYKKKKTGDTEFLPPVSVIICARNEDDNLVEFLPAVLGQDYPDYEVVVVDDCSFDNTGDILKEFATKNEHLKIVTIKEDDKHPHGKKFAVMVGIKGAKNELLLFTDADCEPVSDQWVKNMAAGFMDSKDIVLGYGGYEKGKGLLNKLIRFDTFYIALQYLSFALARKTYMGVGRNMAYRKSLFFKNKGFASHYHIQSGDDDLFINEVASKNNTAVEIGPDSFTLSVPKTTFRDWFRQKKRHVTTARHYKFQTLFLLSLLSCSQYLFFVLFIVILTLQYRVNVLLLVFFFRFILQMIVFKKSMNQLDEKDLFIYSPLFELFFMVLYPTVVFSGFFSKKNKWKI